MLREPLFPAIAYGQKHGHAVSLFIRAEGEGLHLYCLSMCLCFVLLQVDAASTSEGAEGEAQRYFHHAITLRHTLHFLRFNPKMSIGENSDGGAGLGMLLGWTSWIPVIISVRNQIIVPGKGTKRQFFQRKQPFERYIPSSQHSSCCRLAVELPRTL